MRTAMRLTDLLARLHVFTGALPHTQASPTVRAEATRTALVSTPVAASHTATPDLDGALAGLSTVSRESILDPLGRARPSAPLGRPARVLLPFRSSGGPTIAVPAHQVDETTCGSAVLSMLAMAGDPFLALDVAHDPARRFAALQHRVHRASSRTGVVPWPMRFGTTPWAAAALAQFGPVRYTHRVVGGSGRAAVVRAALAAASSGIPVPLFTGGDLGSGWQAAVPRHVVLLVDARPDDGTNGSVVRIYEPSSATLHTVPTAAFLAPESASAQQRAALTAALGHWPHVVWAVLPR